MSGKNDFSITSLGLCNFESPLNLLKYPEGHTFHFSDETEAILVNDRLSNVIKINSPKELPILEMAGPRKNIFFNPKNVCNKFIASPF